MTSQPTGNRSHSVVDDRTQLPAPVGKEVEFWSTARDDGKPDYVVRFPDAIDDEQIEEFIERYTAELAGPRKWPVVAPAQPKADWDRGEDPLPCGKKIRAIGLPFGAGLASGVVLGFLGAVALFALAVS